MPLATRRRTHAALAFALCALAVPATAAAAPPMPNDGVSAVAQLPDGSTVIGGSFTRVGDATGSGSLVSPITGAALPGSPTFDGFVRAAIPDGAGGFYVGGDFAHVNGEPRTQVARIAADGRLDPTFAPTVVGNVYALARAGGTVYLGGSFSQVGGEVRTRLAAVDAVTGAVTGWNPGTLNGNVSSLAVAGGRLYAGGAFRAIGAAVRNGLAAYALADGTLTGWAPELLRAAGTIPGSVNGLEAAGDRVFVVGAFTSVGATPRNGIAAFDGTELSAWDADATLDATAAWLTDVAVAGGTVYVIGNFSAIGGAPRRGIAALELATAQATSWNPSIAVSGGSSVFSTLAVAGDTVYVGGAFGANYRVGGASHGYAVALDASTALASDWAPQPNTQVATIVAEGGAVFVGGYFQMLGGVDRNRLAWIDASGALSPWNPGADGSIQVLEREGGRLYVGGSFTTIAGQERRGLAAFDLADGSLTDWNPGVSSGGVNDLIVSGDTVYVGGSFNQATVGGALRTRLAAVDAATGAATAFDPGAPGVVNALALAGTTLYVGGNYTGLLGGQSRTRLAAVDTITGLATDWDPAPASPVFALALAGDTLYVGGAFTTIAGAPRNRLAAFTGGALSDWNPNAGSTVNALAVAGGKLYAAINGAVPVGGQARGGLAAFDLPSGALDPWAPLTNSAVTALDVLGNTVAVAGSFTTVDGAFGPRFARLSGASASVSRAVTVSGTVPEALGLELDRVTVGLGTFLPGVAERYDATLTGTVTATGPAVLRVSDPGPEPGFLLNDGAPLDAPLRLCAATPDCTYAPLGASPLTLASFATGVTPVTVGLRQAIAAREPLVPGTYGKTLTFALAAGTP